MATTFRGCRRNFEQQAPIYTALASSQSAYITFPVASRHVIHHHDMPGYPPDDRQSSGALPSRLNHDGTHQHLEYPPDATSASHQMMPKSSPVQHDEDSTDDSPAPRRQSLDGQEPPPPHPRALVPPGEYDMLPPSSSTHASWQALHDYAQSHAAEHGYALSINTTAKNRSRIKLACVCYGQPKNTHKLTAETRIRKNRISYKTGCKMWIEGKKQDDGAWLLRVGEPQHNHPGRASEGWAVQRKRTWGVVGGRNGVGGVTAKEELAKLSISDNKDVSDQVEEDGDEEGEAEAEDASSESPQKMNHSLERGGLVWKIVEQEMLRKGEPNMGRDRGVGRTVEVLQARLPGIHIFKRDVYNIRAQIKRARKAAGQQVGQGLNESGREDAEAEAEVDVEDNPPNEPRALLVVPIHHDIRRRSEPTAAKSRTFPQIDPALEPTSIVSPSDKLDVEAEMSRLRRENAELRRLLNERTKEVKEKTIEATSLRAQIEYMDMMLSNTRGGLAG